MSGDLRIHVSCRRCPHKALLPMRDELAASLIHRLRCTRCGALGQVRITVTWWEPGKEPPGYGPPVPPRRRREEGGAAPERTEHERGK